MSNLAKVIIEELEVEEVYVTDVLKCLLHTIVFHRSLGEITPSDCECENLPELRYVCMSACMCVYVCTCQHMCIHVFLFRLLLFNWFKTTHTLK